MRKELANISALVIAVLFIVLMTVCSVLGGSVFHNRRIPTNQEVATLTGYSGQILPVLVVVVLGVTFAVLGAAFPISTYQPKTIKKSFVWLYSLASIVLLVIFLIRIY